MYLVFFFKQKTAYKMRISVCSSDVCSSVLGPVRGAAAHPAVALAHRRDGPFPAGRSAGFRGDHRQPGFHPAGRAQTGRPVVSARNSVVQGKSMEVSVDLGVGLIIKTQNKSKHKRTVIVMGRVFILEL